MMSPYMWWVPAVALYAILSAGSKFVLNQWIGVGLIVIGSILARIKL